MSGTGEGKFLRGGVKKYGSLGHNGLHLQSRYLGSQGRNISNFRPAKPTEEDHVSKFKINK